MNVDVSDGAQVRSAIDAVVSTFGQLNFAHNNAGVFSPALVGELDESEFVRVINVNLTGVFLCMRYQIPHLLEAGGGAIVNTASIWGHIGELGRLHTSRANTGWSG